MGDTKNPSREKPVSREVEAPVRRRLSTPEWERAEGVAGYHSFRSLIRNLNPVNVPEFVRHDAGAIIGKLRDSCERLSAVVSKYINYHKYIAQILFGIAAYITDERIKNLDRIFLRKLILDVAEDAMHDGSQRRNSNDAEHYEFMLETLAEKHASDARIVEPEPATPQETVPWQEGTEPCTELKPDLLKSASVIFAALKAGGADASELRDAFAQAGHPITQVSMPPEDHVPLPAPMELPTVAPELWADKPKGMTATTFLKQHYKRWIESGVLTFKAIEACDPDLAQAYRNRAKRNPDEAVSLAESMPSRFIADPEDAIERRRKSAREGMAKLRASRRDNLTHSPK